MTTRIARFLQGLGASMIVAGALLSPSSLPAGHEAGSGQALRLADGPLPAIFHHWSIATSVADIDPLIFHHWSGAAVKVAEDDPDIFHHWG